MMGGRPEAAEDHYRRWRRVADPPYDLGHVLYARYCLVQRQQREAFERLLRGVSNRPATASSVALFDAMARVRARHYLAVADELFY